MSGSEKTSRYSKASVDAALRDLGYKEIGPHHPKTGVSILVYEIEPGKENDFPSPLTMAYPLWVVDGSLFYNSDYINDLVIHIFGGNHGGLMIKAIRSLN